MSRRDQARIALDDYAVVLIVVGLVVALAGGWIAYDAHAVERTETESVPVDSWTETGGFSHGAEVTEPNPVFPTGTVLQERTQYYAAIAPELTGEYEYRHTADEPRSVEIELTLLLRSVDGGGGTFWQERQTLEQVTVDELSSGDSVEASFRVDVAETEQRIEQIEDGLGATLGTTEAIVVARVTAEGSETPRTVETQQLTLNPGGNTYGVDSPDSLIVEHEETVEEEVPVAVGPLRSIGGPVLLIVGLATMLGVGVARWTGRLDVPAHERERIAFDRTKADLDDWITVGSVPPSVRSGETIHIEDLEGLVDLAIDAGERVIEDPQANQFLVIDERTTYVYTRDEEGVSPDDPGPDEEATADYLLPLDEEDGSEAPSTDTHDTPVQASEDATTADASTDGGSGSFDGLSLFSRENSAGAGDGELDSPIETEEDGSDSPIETEEDGSDSIGMASDDGSPENVGANGGTAGVESGDRPGEREDPDETQ